MHYHLEIIMPPTDDVNAQVANIMSQFDENYKEEEDRNLHPFWDWFVIGGRWSGVKGKMLLDQDKLKKFYDLLSAFTSGKQTLDPKEQIPIVDALWNECFPDAKVKRCPFFSHYNDQYAHEGQKEDISLLGETPGFLTCERIIFASPKYQDENNFEAHEMYQEKAWNGCNYEKTVWDGTLTNALVLYHKSLGVAQERGVTKYTPKADWLIVTVDYHS